MTPKRDAIYTRVIFRKFRKRDGGEVIALFPTLPDDRDGYMCVSYMHVGQHGGADPGIVNRTKLATPKEYAPLLRELRGLGYRPQITHRFHARFNEQRRRAAQAVRG